MVTNNGAMRLKLAVLLFAGVLFVAVFQWTSEQTIRSVKVLAGGCKR
jgi:hypothetical protein